MFVSCHMPKKVRVGRSGFFLFFFPMEILRAKLKGKSGFAKKKVKNCENSVFEKKSLGSGPLPKDGPLYTSPSPLGP
mgnify:CR=1 FL=1